MTTANDILGVLESMADEKQAANLRRFFKTGKGQYGEGDVFLGLKVPMTRGVVKEARLDVTFEEIEKLLYSKYHEARLAGLMLLVEEMKAALPRKSRSPLETARRREEIVAFYLKHARQANNWDLVDMTCPKILGEWLLHTSSDGDMPDRTVLDRLAESDNLWEQRISIVSTWRLIRASQYDDAIRISEKLLGHQHDLIHKAVGWMLREVGKKEPERLSDFLESHHSAMHRTTLRYAIEKMPPLIRQFWLRYPNS